MNLIENDQRDIPGRGPAAPFSTDAEYLDAEFGWLALRRARQEMEAELEELALTGDCAALPPYPYRGRMQPGTLKRRLSTLKDREAKQRARIDRALSSHRATRGLPRLRLDEVCNSCGLDAKERTILIACTVPTFGPRELRRVFGRERYLDDAIYVCEAIEATDPQGAADWLAARKYFFETAPLLKHGLIVVKAKRDPEWPWDYLHCPAIVTETALARIAGSGTETEAFIEEMGEWP